MERFIITKNPELITFSKEDIDDAIKFRRLLHEYPEVSGEEYQTTLRIKDVLDEHNIPYESVLGTGVTAIIDGEKPGATIALRADIDALPIEELNDLNYKSSVLGVMHACGHDAHTAMMLTVCKVLHRNRHLVHGRVIIVFQPSEEDAPIGGAGPMLEAGVFDTYKPDAIFAQHVWPGLELGKFGIMSGPIMGNSDRIKITVQGKGGHAAQPHTAIDPIIITNQIITSIQSIISRNVDPFDPAVITIGEINGGVAPNIIADTVEMKGSMRSLTRESREIMKTRLRKVVEDAATAHGGSVEIEIVEGYPATVNDANWASVLREIVIDEYGIEAAPTLRPSLAGEDFSRFLMEIPGVYYWLGMDEKKESYPLHHPKFNANENSFEFGINILLKLALKALATLNNNGKG